MNPYQQGRQYMHNIGFNNQAPQSFSNPSPMPGFPTAGPARPQSGQSQSGYPEPHSGYAQPQSGYPQPQSGGYPCVTPCGFPPQGGYPQENPAQGYPQANPSQGYSQVNSVYPGSIQGYPGCTQSYPTQGYPSTGNHQGYQGCPHSVQSYVSNRSSYSSGSQRQENASSYHYPQWTPPPNKPTVVPANPFDPRKDAEILRKAMKGFGTDEKAIIQVLTRRSNEQRLRIAFEFKTLYGKDLVSDLKSETTGNFEDLLVALMTPLPQFYAKELHDAMACIGTDEDVLIEVMCTMSNHEINVIKQAYAASFGTMLEDDLRGDTSGNFKRLMTSLCVGNRSEDFHVDPVKVQDDASSLLRAGEMRLGTDESVFNAILCSRSYPQLAAIFAQYKHITGHDIETAISNEFSGDIKNALLAIVKVVNNKPLFFAERLHKSMKGMGTNDRQLIRIMVTRSEVDLAEISQVFERTYGKSLASWIEGDCSGHYKKCLLGLLGLY